MLVCKIQAQKTNASISKVPDAIKRLQTKKIKTMKIQKPKNDWAKAIYILYQSHTAGTNMLKVLNQWDRNFWKFQTRLSEVIAAYPTLRISKLAMPFKSQLTGKTGYFTQYTPISSKETILKIYNKVNEKGLTNSTKK